MADKQQISIFRIAFNEVRDFLQEEHQIKDASSEQIIDFIAKAIKRTSKPLELQFKKSVEKHFSPNMVRGFYVTVPVDFVWADFFEPHLTEDHDANQALLTTRRTAHKSFFIFIYSDKNIYCFSGGLGYHYLKDFIDDDFGISILQKIDFDEELQFLMLRSRSVVGNVAVDQRIFRDIHRTVDENNLGRVYKDLAAKIPFSKSLLNLKQLIFDNKDTTKKNVHAGQSFRFSKSISFKELSEIITFFDKQIKKDTKFVLSSLKPIKKDKDHSKLLVTQLTKNLGILLFEIFEDALTKRKSKISSYMEITNSKFMKFYDCDKIVISRRGVKEVCKFESPYGLEAKQLIQTVVMSDKDYIERQCAEIKRKKKDDSIEDLKISLVKSYVIRCYLEDSEEQSAEVEGNLFDFIACEMEYKDIPYFYLDSIWYKSETNFLSSLNEEFLGVYKANSYAYPLNKWASKDNENSYLENIIDSKLKNTLVMHKVTRSVNMELCDFIHWNKNDIYLGHVKPSFDGDVRVLINQITHACRLLEEDIRNGLNQNSNLYKYFNEAQKYSGPSPYLSKVKGQFEKWDFKTFADLFKKRKINYLAVIVDSSGRNLDDIQKFESNIAKMSIIEGYRTIRSIGSPNSHFLITQIPLK